MIHRAAGENWLYLLWDNHKALYISINRLNVRSSVNLSNLAVNGFLNWPYFAVTKKSLPQKRITIVISFLRGRRFTRLLSGLTSNPSSCFVVRVWLCA